MSHTLTTIAAETGLDLNELAHPVLVVCPHCGESPAIADFGKFADTKITVYNHGCQPDFVAAAHFLKSAGLDGTLNAYEPAVPVRYVTGLVSMNGAR